VRELIGDYLAGAGFTVTRASDGRGAQTALQRHPGRFGLVITDLQMPGADGFAVLSEARRANPQCYVVIVKGYASLDTAIQAVRGGAYDYLPKPFSLGQLDVILKRISEHVILERASRGQQPPRPLAASSRHPLPPLPFVRTGTTQPGLAYESPPPRPATDPRSLDERLRSIELALERLERQLRQQRESSARH
jgi:DNA-binding response OmpR family regulator